MAPTSISQFQRTVWDYYRDHRRPMPWRENHSPYSVVVSEVMLQQTQVARVLEKYPLFMRAFPGFEQLAMANLADLLGTWQGMGYNRRALHLQKLARQVLEEYGGELPSDPKQLQKLSGIGAGTAGAIAAFAFNQPVVFIETNIRRVIIHHFFSDRSKVPDGDLLSIIERSLDRGNPREWYYALMDYGAHLVKTVPNPNRRSRHYTQQSKFEGSDRQIRGAIVRLLLEFPVLTAQDVVHRFPAEPQERIVRILDQLTKEGFLQQR
jgi:A/G-specific adenine glycosylase